MCPRYVKSITRQAKRASGRGDLRELHSVSCALVALVADDDSHSLANLPEFLNLWKLRRHRIMDCPRLVMRGIEKPWAPMPSLLR